MLVKNILDRLSKALPGEPLRWPQGIPAKDWGDDPLPPPPPPVRPRAARGGMDWLERLKILDPKLAPCSATCDLSRFFASTEARGYAMSVC
jgi:hypothetical protein